MRRGGGLERDHIPQYVLGAPLQHQLFRRPVAEDGERLIAVPEPPRFTSQDRSADKVPDRLQARNLAPLLPARRVALHRACTVFGIHRILSARKTPAGGHPDV